MRDVREDGLMSYLSAAQVEELKEAFIRDLTLSVKLAGMTLLGVRERPADLNEAFEKTFSEGYTRVLLISLAAPFLSKERLMETDRMLSTCGSVTGWAGEEFYIFGKNALGEGEKHLPERRLMMRPSDLGELHKAMQKGEIFLPSSELVLSTLSCVGCGRCLKNCIMLKTYHVDLKALAKADALMDACFLCGTCTDKCLSKIDGRRVVECLRRRRVLENGTVERAPEKVHVRGEKTVFFPGCTLLKTYPETLKQLEMFFASQDIETVKGCCMKTLYETGAYEEADRAIENLIKRFEEKGAGKVVFACPDCYYFLRDRLPFVCSTVYETLQERGLGKTVPGKANVYLPCPDRKEKLFYKSAEVFSQEGFTEAYQKLQCCGAGGGVKNTHPDLAEKLSKKVNNRFYGRGSVTTLCGTCAKNFRDAGKKDVTFFLEELFQRETF